MARRATKGLLLAATVLGGLLAGGNFVRMFIEMPAWHAVGAGGWAAFSRHADLGHGLLLYPLLAIGAAALTLAAAVSFRLDADAPAAAAIPIYLGALLVIAGLALTGFAAPQMLSLRAIGDDPPRVQAAFDAFEYWGNLRGIVQMLAFGANAWALSRR